MKRNVFKLFFVVVMAVLFVSNVNASSVNLEQIKDAINANSLMAESSVFGIGFEAYYDEDEPNVLTVVQSIGEQNTAISYELDGNVLSYNYLTDETVFSALVVADSIGKLQGYDYGEIFSNYKLFFEDFENYGYNVEEEGFELNLSNSYYSVSMDITKKYPLIDLSNYYFKPSDFYVIAEMVESNTVGNQSGENSFLAYNLFLHREQNEIYIAEVNENTQRTYKSILSALEVMYNTDVVEYFKREYPVFESGMAQRDGFTVYYDVELDDDFESFEGKKVVKVEVDNRFMKNRFMPNLVTKDKTLTLDFSTNKSYILKDMDSVSDSDAGFFYKYILEKVFMESDVELGEDFVVYFNVVDGKVVVGDKENSVLKVTVNDDSIVITPTKNDVDKTTVKATHNDIEIFEYQDEEFINEFYDNVFINITYGKNKYKVLNGDNQSVNISNNGELTFRFDILYSKFLEEGKVYVDGELVDSSNYTSKSGSTIITFNSDFVKNLAIKEHTLKVVVADGEVETTFTIINNDTIKNPKTSDNLTIYLADLLISIVGLVLISVMKKKSLN